jgi:hypothetical protein
MRQLYHIFSAVLALSRFIFKMSHSHTELDPNMLKCTTPVEVGIKSNPVFAPSLCNVQQDIIGGSMPCTINCTTVPYEKCFLYTVRCCRMLSYVTLLFNLVFPSNVRTSVRLRQM